ncbi:hypothetical protein FOCC_FOCC016866 [Frankliniella occidentalis]|nr:hypothetical protein FOCC_FOCC016866 [Frankliniella occidentalis]
MADNPRLWIFDEKKEDIDAYIERWEARFRRKELTSDSKKIDWFIEDCGQAMHNALRTLSRPLQVKDLRWDQITATLVQHWGPRRNKHLERRKFRARVRQAGESFNDFALALRDLSQFCDFQDLNESLIEAFLNGLGDQEVLKHLVSQDFETFNEYVAESYNRQASMRVVDTNNTTVNAVASTSKKKSGKKNKSGTGNTANNVTFHTAGKQTPKPSPQPNQKPQPTQKPPATPKPSAATPGKQPDNVCFGCGQLHFRSNCPYKNATCFGCHQVGHVKSVCGKFRNNTNLVSGNFQTPPLKDMPNDGFGFGDNFGGLCHISVANLSPPIPEAGKKVFVDVQVNHQPITAQLDCGAIVTICGEPLYQARWADSPLRNPLLDLQGPPANNIDVKGVIDVTVKCAEGDLTLPLYVAKGHFPFLLGNNWIPFLELDYNKLLKKSKHPEICALQRTELEELAQQFPYCFGKVAGPIEGYEARVRLKDNAIPKFIPHREPPIPLRQPTEKELKRMEEAQFLRPVLYSKWASPTVIVPKKNGQEVRICGDYSATVNPQVETAYYPIPKIDHLSMVSGKYFTKLDMKDAYCHVKIAEEDQEILTLSTHVGLKAVMRLLFGLSFAPAEFIYNFTLKHKRSQEIPHADCLSRIPGEENTPIENEDNTIYFVDYLPITASEIREQTTKDPVLSRVVSYVQFGWPDTPVDPVFEAYKRKGIELTLEVGCLLWGSRVVIPTVLREQVKYLLHSEHLGESKIKMLARSHVYWPDIDKDIEDFVKKCSVCRVLDVQKKPMPVIPWTWSTAPWKRIFVDFAKKDGVTFMITVDHHSKYPFVEIMQSTTATAVIGYLKILFAQFGFPCELVADNGPPFDAAAFKEFLKNHHTTLKHSPVGHPQSNGEAEKMVQTFKKTLLKQLLDPETAHRTLQDQVSSFLYSYRNTPHVLTKCPPSELFLKRQMRTHFTVLNPLTNLNEKVQNRLNDTAQKRGGKFKEFNAGDTVWVRVMIDNNKFIYKPAVIQRRVSSDSYDIMLNGRVRHTSAEHMYYRDPNADPIDLLDLPRLTQEPEQIEIPVPVPVQKKTANDSPASIPRVEKILQSPQQTPIPVANSTPKGIEQELSIPKSPSMGQPPQTPARASTPSQPSGRRLFNTPPSPTHRPKRNAGRPRYLQDYV